MRPLPLTTEELMFLSMAGMFSDSLTGHFPGEQYRPCLTKWRQAVRPRHHDTGMKASSNSTLNPVRS
jgi:hypothetical protein